MEEDIVSQKQFVRGFDRTFSIVSDLALDTPAAGRMIEEYAQRAMEDRVLPANYAIPK